MAAVRGAAAPVLGPARAAGGAGRRVADGGLHLPRGARAHIGQLPVPGALVASCLKAGTRYGIYIHYDTLSIKLSISCFESLNNPSNKVATPVFYLI